MEPFLRYGSCIGLVDLGKNEPRPYQRAIHAQSQMAEWEGSMSTYVQCLECSANVSAGAARCWKCGTLMPKSSIHSSPSSQRLAQEPKRSTFYSAQERLGMPSRRRRVAHPMEQTANLPSVGNLRKPAERASTAHARVTDPPTLSPLQKLQEELEASIQALVEELANQLNEPSATALFTGREAVQVDNCFARYLKQERQFAIFMGKPTATFAEYRLPHKLIGAEDDVQDLASDPEGLAELTAYFVAASIEASYELDAQSGTYKSPMTQRSVAPKRRAPLQTSGAASRHYTDQVARGAERAEGADGIQLALGLTGVGLLFLGVFAPLVYVPIIGDINYFQNGKGDGVIILIIAAVATVSILLKKYRSLWIESLATLAVLAYTYFDFQDRLEKARAQLNIDVTDNPFAGLGEMTLRMVQIQWGWGVLVFGALLLLVAAIRDIHSR